MKKYSDKFLKQSDKLKKAVVGIEFEFYLKDISYYKTLEILNEYLSPVKVWGFRQYHSDFKVNAKNFKIEPDLSGGSNMVEFITGPLNYYDAKYYLVKMLKFIQNYGYSNDKSSIHFNISFNDEDMDLNDLNILKLILNTDEEEIYRAFPGRKNNIYSKSVKNMIPYKEYDFFNVPISVVKNNLKLPDDKYYGINFLNIEKNKESQRIEFRYLGGKDYEKNIGQNIYFMERFIINSHDSINAGFDSSDITKLVEFLEENITNYKTLSKYDNFIVEFPTVQLQIDQISDYDIIIPYYHKIYHRIYDLVNSTENLENCIVNYVTETKTLEIIDANVKTISTIKTIDFINCTLDGIFDDCYFVNCELMESQLSKSKLKQTEATNCKILNCNVEGSTLKNCYFVEGYLNSDMIGGIYRSGELGPNATMDSDVKIVKDYDNFFDIRFDTDDEKGTDKGIIKAFGKNKLLKQ